MSKIDVSKIEGFEEMSAEDKIKALMEAEIEVPNAKDSDDYQKLKNSFNKASSDVADLKKQLKDKMSEQERMEAERKEADAEKDALLKSLLREKEVSGHTADFLSIGFDSDLAKKSAEAMADGDSKTIFANFKTFIENHDKGIKAEVLKSTPAPVSGGVGKEEMTKEKFANMSYSEMVKFKNENPEQYQELMKQ